MATQTVQGRSLHIGLNQVDSAHYRSWSSNLRAAESDAAEMARLASSGGIQVTILAGREATASRVTAVLRESAAELRRGDLFLLTFSGCGGQVPDGNSDEADTLDDTWVLYDRQWVSDELWSLLSGFAAGVRVVMITDACFSGTMSRAMPPNLGSDPRSTAALRPKCLPPRQAAKVYQANRHLYNQLQKANPAEVRVRIRASVLMLSAAQDNQFALDGEPNSLFTTELLEVWQKGRFAGSYKRFRDLIAQRMPMSQTPMLQTRGKDDSAFLGQKPFTV